MVVPPKPIKQSYYRCGSRFYLDDILKMYQTDKQYGLIGVSGEEVTYYMLNLNKTHSSIKKIGSLTQDLATYHRKGGQSQNRHQRNHQIQRKTFLTKMVEKSFELYFKDRRTTSLIEKLAIFGPGKTKETLFRHPEIQQWFELLGPFSSADLKETAADDIVFRFRNVFEVNPEDEALREINECLEIAPERLLFGLHEVSEYPCEKIWITGKDNHKRLKLITQKTRVIDLPSSFELHYGSVVGLRMEQGSE